MGVSIKRCWPTRWPKTHDRPFIVGSFSAASNVTGVVSDVSGITRRLKEQGALAVWDYAAGAPYLSVDMNARRMRRSTRLSFSPHKFIGGPGSSGVLAVKRKVLRNDRAGANWRWDRGAT